MTSRLPDPKIFFSMHKPYRNHKLKDCTIRVHYTIDAIKKCEICGSGKILCIDHEHGKDVARGKLCKSCNYTLGGVEKAMRLGILAKMISYLRLRTFCK